MVFLLKLNSKKELEKEIKMKGTYFKIRIVIASLRLVQDQTISKKTIIMALKVNSAINVVNSLISDRSTRIQAVNIHFVLNVWLAGYNLVLNTRLSNAYLGIAQNQ